MVHESRDSLEAGRSPRALLAQRDNAAATAIAARLSSPLLKPKTHNGVTMRPHDAESDQQLERSELVRGYEFSKGQYVIVTEEELAATGIDSPKKVFLRG